MRRYEGMFLFDNNAAHEWPAVETEVKRLCDRIEANLQVCLKFDERKLAYEVDGHKRGTYVLTYFDAPPERIDELERDARLSESVLRLLVLRAEKMTDEQLAPLKEHPADTSLSPASEGRRGERDGRRGDRWRSDGPRSGPRDGSREGPREGAREGPREGSREGAREGADRHATKPPGSAKDTAPPPEAATSAPAAPAASAPVPAPTTPVEAAPGAPMPDEAAPGAPTPAEASAGDEATPTDDSNRSTPEDKQAPSEE